MHIARCKVSPELDSVCCRMAVYRIPRGGRRIKTECIELRIIFDTSNEGEPVVTILEPMGED